MRARGLLAVLSVDGDEASEGVVEGTNDNTADESRLAVLNKVECRAAKATRVTRCFTYEQTLGCNGVESTAFSTLV